MHQSLRGVRRLAVSALLVVALFALVTTAFAAQAGTYKGKTVSSKLPVGFKLSGGKVRSFQGGISMYCVFEGTFKFDAVIPPRAMRVNGNRFDYKGKDRHGSEIEVHGRFVSSRKAKGWIQMGAGGCSGKTNFWATLRS